MGIHLWSKEERYKKILQKKKSTSAEELCKGFPKEFVDYINYTRNLEFESDPDYNYLRNLLVKVLQQDNCKFDFWYDWVKEKPEITDQIAVERYINNNTNVSLELKGDDKKEKEGETKDNENEKENISLSKYNSVNTITTGNNTNNDADISRNSTDVRQNNSGFINASTEVNNTNESVGKTDNSADKKNNKKSKESKKKDKKEKNKNCSIW